MSIQVAVKGILRVMVQNIDQIASSPSQSAAPTVKGIGLRPVHSRGVLLRTLSPWTDVNMAFDKCFDQISCNKIKKKMTEELIPPKTYLFLVAISSLYFGGFIAHKGASYLEENEIFVPADDDDDD